MVADADLAEAADKESDERPLHDGVDNHRSAAKGDRRQVQGLVPEIRGVGTAERLA